MDDIDLDQIPSNPCDGMRESPYIEKITASPNDVARALSGGLDTYRT